MQRKRRIHVGDNNTGICNAPTTLDIRGAVAIRIVKSALYRLPITLTAHFEFSDSARDPAVMPSGQVTGHVFSEKVLSFGLCWVFPLNKIIVTSVTTRAWEFPLA